MTVKNTGKREGEESVLVFAVSPLVCVLQMYDV